MKCFKTLLYIIGLAFCFSASSATYEIFPTDKQKIVTGDFTTVQVSSTEEKLPNLVGKRLGGILYVMKQDGNRLDVIVAPPQKGEDALKEGDDRYILKGFEFEHKKNDPIQSYLTEDFDYNLKKAPFFFYVILILFLIFAIVGGLKFLKARREKSRIKEERKRRANELMAWMKTVEKRRELENAAQKVDEIEELFEFSQKKLNRFLSDLNVVQFKRDWSKEEEESVKKSYSDFLSDLKVKSGI